MSERKAKDVQAIAYVEWIDSGSLTDGWASLDDVLDKGVTDSKSPIRSVGFLALDDADGIALLGSLNDTHDETIHGMWIPRSAIVRMDLWTPPETT